MKIIYCSLLIAISFPLFAGTKTCVREYTYKAGEADSKITSRAIALDQVKRILLEEIGVYLQSSIETKKEERDTSYKELTMEQVQSITAGITETKIIEERWNGEIYYIKASITVDPDEVNKNIARIGADQSKLKELVDIKRKADDAFAEIERLRKELALSKSENDKVAKQEEYIAASNTLSASDWFEKGYNAAELKDYDNSILYFQKAIELKPDYVYAYYNMGNIKFALSDYEGAIADYSEAISLKPELAEAYYNRGTVKIKLEDYQGTITDCNEAIELRPDYTDAYINRGIARSEIEDNQGAIADFTKATDLQPSANAYHCRGLVKNKLEDYQGAIVDYTEAISLEPELAEAYYNRGVAKNKLKDNRGAIADYTKAIGLKPNYAYAYGNRGLAKGILYDWQGAIADFTEAINLKPDYARAYYNRGLVYSGLDQKSKALADFMRAIEMGYRVSQEVLDMCK
ncbi:MAG: tetratricopeptide repeat protein [Bacteroidota bacterium]|jgi:tetratricopeptide (TPR) repeat protein